MKNISISLVLTVFVIAAGFTFKQTKPWKVPEVSANKKNASPADAQTVATGKSLWDLHCKSCHGAKGLGDGSKSAQLKTVPGDFTKNETQSQKDGALFFKISEGRDDMPSYKKKIPDEDDRWALVNYIRELKK